MIYHIVRAFVTFWAKLTGCRLTGLENIPQEGAAILICNHISNFDPILLACTTKRQIRFMAKSEFFNNKFIKKIFDLAGAFPVSRGESDITALKKAVSILKENQLLGIFPEGHRNMSGQLHPFKKGVTLIAYKGQVSVIPVAVKDSGNFFCFWRRQRPLLLVGAPIAMPAGKTPDMLEEYTDVFRGAVEDLQNLLYD